MPEAPLPGPVGVVACLGGRPEWLEILPSSEALGTFWSSLVDVALLDAYSAPAVPCLGQVARVFVVYCRSLNLQAGEMAGAGRSVNARHRCINIRGITSPEGDLLHAMAVDTDARLRGGA